MRFSRRGLLTALLVVAALFVGSFITERIPDPNEFRDAPFLVAGGMGEPVRLRTADVTVTGVQSARRIAYLHNTAETTGVWLVVDIIWAARQQPTTLIGSSPELLARDGRVFGGRQAIPTNCGPAQPGFPLACQLPFELPEDALEGLRLRVPASPGTAEDVTDIDLGITAELAARLQAGTPLLVLRQPTVTP